MKSEVWFVRSATELNRFYRVGCSRTGIFSCTCGDFIFHGNECKHIKKVKRQLAGKKQKNKLPGCE